MDRADIVHDAFVQALTNTKFPSWGYSIVNGATSIWERWNSYTHEGGISKSSMNSFNHYAYGACSEWMFYTMLGIDTGNAAYKEIRMKPEVPALSGAEGRCGRALTLSEILPVQ